MKYLFYPITILLLALTCTEFFPVLMYACKHIVVYQWLLYGMGAYFIFLGILDNEENYNEILADEYVKPEIEYEEPENE